MELNRRKNRNFNTKLTNCREKMKNLDNKWLRIVLKKMIYYKRLNLN